MFCIWGRRLVIWRKSFDSNSERHQYVPILPGTYLSQASSFPKIWKKDASVQFPQSGWLKLFSLYLHTILNEICYTLSRQPELTTSLQIREEEWLKRGSLA